MTVREYVKTTGPDFKTKESDSQVICEWFEGFKKQSGTFLQDQLERVQ
jgi:uncharacterized protein YodC (DUF2158 family)